MLALLHSPSPDVVTAVITAIGDAKREERGEWTLAAIASTMRHVSREIASDLRILLSKLLSEVQVGELTELDWLDDIREHSVAPATTANAIEEWAAVKF